MEIKVKIEAPGLESAIHTLAQVLGNFDYPVDLPKGQPDIEPEKEKEKAPEPKPVDKPKEEPAKEEKVEVKKEEPASQPEVSLEVVRAKLADLSRDGKQEDVKSLISSFGVNKLSEVDASKYGELLKKAEKL